MMTSFNSWLNNHSLKFKLNISILTCVLLGFLCLVFLISKQAEPIIKSQIDDNAQKTVETYGHEFAHLVSDTENIIINAKNTLNQTSESNLGALQTVLNSALKTVESSDLKFTNAWVYAFPPEDVSQGTLYISNHDEQNRLIDFHVEQVDNFYDFFPWFKKVPKEEKVYWSEPYFDKVLAKTVVTCLIPFKFAKQNDFNGLVALTVDLSDIERSINNFSFYETGKLLLLSRSGLYVTYPDPDVALKMTIFELADKLNLPPLKTIGRDLARGRKGQISIPNLPVFKGTAVFYYAPIPNIGWSFCLVYEQNYLLRPLHKFKIMMLVSLAICILLLLFVINWISRNATNQLITLGNIAENYGQGNFAESFTDKPLSTDIKQLAKALSDMRINLLDYINKERNVASEKQKALSELDIARHIQNSALATKYPQNKAFQVATKMIPAQQVGGDFYDFFFIDSNKFAVVVADVSGKGIPASLYMMKALTLIKNISRSKRSLDFVFHHVNEQLCEGNDTCMFVTAFMAVIDLTTGLTKFVNAGHNPPLICDKAKCQFLTPQRNIVLGINPKAVFIEETMQLNPHNQLFLYTDGVTEAENKTKEFYGEKRLLKIFEKATENPEENLKIVLNDIKKFTQNTPQSDDITMLDFVFYGAHFNSLTLAADNKKIADLIKFLKKDMNKHKIKEDTQFNVIMAAEEIFSNIAQYGYTTQKNASVTIHVNKIAEYYTLTFIDNGKKYNPLKNKNPDITQKITERSIGGLGVFLTKKLADTLTYTYQNRQNVLTIGIKLTEK